MAMLNGTTTTNFLPNSHIESAQSMIPTKETNPRLSRQVAVTDFANSSIFRRRFHVILYYKKASSEDSGWLVTGWMRLSLGKALEEQPILAGRLRRGDEGEGELEIVPNDSGIRIIEARISTTLAEFLDLKEREDAEAELVFWNDIDNQNPQFSPLFYIQVTNFQCGGYSMGISCSLLLADPLCIISFLRRWVNIHKQMFSEANVAKLPLFYLPNFKPNGSSFTMPFGSDRVKNCGKTMIFKAATTKIMNLNNEARNALALQCVKEAESKLGVKMASNFSFLVKELSEEVIKVEKFAREGLVQKVTDCGSGLSCANWKDLGGSEVSFFEGNKPACVSYWMDSIPGEGFVILFPSVDESVTEMNIFVTVPSETEM